MQQVLKDRICGHGCNNECTHVSFFSAVRTFQIVYHNNIPFLTIQKISIALLSKQFPFLDIFC